MSKYNYFIGLIFSLIFLTGCKDEEKAQLKSYVSSFVSNHEQVVGYGFIDIDAIVEKSEIEKVSGIGSFVAEQMKSMKNGMAIKDGIHYALTGPFARNGSPEKAFVFISVENKDSLQSMFETMGYMFEEDNGVMKYDDMTTAIGFDDNLAILVMSTMGSSPREDLDKALVKVKDKNQNPKVVEILELETDILFGTHLENLYSTSNTTLEGLPVEKKAEIIEMVKDGHFSTTVDFNPGNITIKANTERVSDKLKEKYFFKGNAGTKIAEKIGPGKPLLAMTAALDIPKMEKFYKQMNPQGTKEMYRSLGMGGFFLQAFSGEGIGSIINGELGYAIFSLPDNTRGMSGNVPDFKAYAGLGSNHKLVNDLITTFSEEGNIEDLGDGFYRIDSMMIQTSKEELLAQTNVSSKDEFKTGSLGSVSGMENFGEKPLSVFVNIKELRKFGAYMPQEAKLIMEMSEYLTVEADNSGATVIFQLTNKEKNALQQVLGTFQKKMQMQFGGGMEM